MRGASKFNLDPWSHTIVIQGICSTPKDPVITYNVSLFITGPFEVLQLHCFSNLYLYTFVSIYMCAILLAERHIQEFACIQLVQ